MTEGYETLDGFNPRTLRAMQAEVREINEANGWYDHWRSLGDDLALINSEIAEAFEAYRNWGFKDVTLGESMTMKDGSVSLPKPEGVGSELADVLIRVLDTCERRDVMFTFWDAELKDIAAYRPFTKGDDRETFGDKIHILHALATGYKLDKLVHALLAVAAEHNIDLQYEYDRKVAFNRTRGYRHGNKLV